MPLTIEKSWALRKLKSLAAVAGLRGTSLLELLKFLRGECHRDNLCNHRLLGNVLVHWYNILYKMVFVKGL